MKAGDWFEPGTGTPLAYPDLIARAARAPAVLLGETHDRADIHRWQMHVSAALLAHGRPLVLGFEMFPARLDPVLAEWVAGDLDETTFLDRAEWGEVWNFPPELYLPIFRFCRDTGTEMIGLNCRRGLVSEVGKLGWDEIAEEAREGLTPARDASPDYRRYLFEVTGGARPDRQAQSPEDPAFDRFVRAQQTWDRAFACRIAARAAQDDAPLVIGIIGRGHLEFRGGTPWQLEDLGISDAMVFLPWDAGTPHHPGQADAACVMPRLPAD
ncbi:MAG: ChaN family lipoprotein [Roseovarius sp.]|uniref:ChaN family lipoprotein n=1 Tax=Roseovarius sp. TaxID=1486281 RepID=UPI0032EE863B